MIFDFLLSTTEAVDIEKASKAFTHHLNQASNEETVLYLLRWSANKKLNIISILNSYKENLEKDDNTSWTEDSSLKFFAVINGNTNRPSDFYETFFNKAIERGIFSAVTPVVAKRVSGVLKETWNFHKGVTQNLLKDYKNAIERTTHLQDTEKSNLLTSLEAIAKQNNLSKELGFEKPSLLNKVTDKIAEFVSGKDEE